jgi:protein transport protein SEC24
MEDGQQMFLWLGRNLSSDFVAEVLGVQGPVENLKCSELTLAQPSTEQSIKVHNIINSIVRQQHTYQQLIILKQHDPLELQFRNFLVEDAANDGMSYVDFLCHIHKQIQQRLA